MNMNAHHSSRTALVLEACFISAACSLGACSTSGQAQSAADVQKKQSEEEARLDKSTQLISDFRSQVPDAVASRAQCVMIVPGFKKGGFLVGGEGGKGFATCMSSGAWSSPAPIKVGGGTFGAQLGYESADVLALIESDTAAKAFQAGNFKIGASASAAAGPTGGTASATGDVGMKSDILTYSHSGGLFAGATLNGTTVSSDDEATRALYGTNADLASILQRRATMAQPGSVQRFLGAMTQSFAPAAVGIGEAPSLGGTATSR
jgi:lipid-binding SYLF domain-containing protein